MARLPKDWMKHYSIDHDEEGCREEIIDKGSMTKIKNQQYQFYKDTERRADIDPTTGDEKKGVKKEDKSHE